MRHAALDPFGSALLFADSIGPCAARKGAVISRKVRAVERFIGRDVFPGNMKRRRFSEMENAGQFAVVCNHDPIQWLL